MHAMKTDKFTLRKLEEYEKFVAYASPYQTFWGIVKIANIENLFEQRFKILTSCFQHILFCGKESTGLTQFCSNWFLKFLYNNLRKF